MLAWFLIFLLIAAPIVIYGSLVVGFIWACKTIAKSDKEMDDGFWAM